MDVTRIHEYTDIYMEAYMRALNKTHNADLAVQVAMGVTFAVTNTLEAQKPKTPCSRRHKESILPHSWRRCL